LHDNQEIFFLIDKEVFTYCTCLVAGVSSILNSATGTLRCAICGANIAAGYTIAEVPMTRQASHVSTMSTAVGSV